MPNIVIQSRASNTPVLLRFINKTNRRIDIIWLDFTGRYVPYKTLQHNQFLDVNTYTKHPWIFLDSKTHDRMCVRNKSVYFPTPAFCPESGRIGRICVPITLPLYSLRTNALLVVRNLLQNAANIDCLDLPNELKNDLQKVFDQKDKNVYVIQTPNNV